MLTGMALTVLMMEVANPAAPDRREPIELNAVAPGRVDHPFDPLSDVVQVHMAWHELSETVGNGDDGLLPKSASDMPVARQRARAPAMLRPWVVVRLRYPLMSTRRNEVGTRTQAGSAARPSPTPIPHAGARRTIAFAAGVVENHLTGGIQSAAPGAHLEDRIRAPHTHPVSRRQLQRKENAAMALIDFGGVKEKVVMRDEFPMSKARKVLKDETIAVIGYGVQGPAQALNMKDNGFNVIVGQSSEFKRDWDRERKDGWRPGKDLFDIDEAARRGTIVQMLVSDAAQKVIWSIIKQRLEPGNALYFSR
jgi:hypothetical protein